MYSMTGFGKGEYRDMGIHLVVEVKSVNNRFLDVAIKAPRLFNAIEEQIRSKIRESITRGHVDVFISYTDKREKESVFSVDLSAANAYLEAASKVAKAHPEIANDVTISSVLRFPDVLLKEESSDLDEALKAAADTALTLALASLADSRKREGERLKKDLLSRMDEIERLHGEIAKRAPLVSEEYRKKLTQRIEEYLGGTVDETRILTEAALFADKCNIDEELTRLSSHIAEFRRLCGLETVGRKLDFLVQEFNRECNTVCSKSNDAKITACALDMKNEIEKVREQIQNLE